jgi:glycosyltransferase involved in cell wall biosynthesis
MIEAMACGTPVLAFRKGSVPEVIEDGLSGYLVDTEEEAVAVLPQTLLLDRRRVRRRFEERFSACRMAANYVAVYEKLLQRSVGDGVANRPSLVGDALHQKRQARVIN